MFQNPILNCSSNKSVASIPIISTFFGNQCWILIFMQILQIYEPHIKYECKFYSHSSLGRGMKFDGLQVQVIIVV